MADSLPDSIDASALERYDKLALRITRDSFADTFALHDALFSGDVAKNYQKAGLAPVRFGTDFHATMESFASEQGHFTGDIDSMLVASVWQVNLPACSLTHERRLLRLLLLQLCKWMMLTLMLMLPLLLSHLQMQLKVLLLLLLSNLMQALVLLLLQQMLLTHTLT